MSSAFRDAFTKDKDKEPLLDYDDSAFFYFASSFLVLFVVPATYYFLKSVFGPKKIAIDQQPADKDVVYCKCSLCVNKESRIRREAASPKRFLRMWFLLKLALLAVGWFCLIFCIQQIMSSQTEIKTFDPFAILETDPGADETLIRKAYRRLSLKWHPDKNQNDPMAASQFVLISKAYQALTDPVARENYEKYGNPDGPQAMKVAIGLPRFLLNEENHLMILIVFFSLLLIVLPVIVLCWYHANKKFAENGLMNETFVAFYQIVSENHRVKQLPEVLAVAAECRALKPRPSDNKDLPPLFAAVKDHLHKPKFTHPAVLKGNVLLHAHMLRMHDRMSDALRDDLDAMLLHVPKLIEAMVEVSYLPNNRRWLQTVISIIELSQLLVQALWLEDSSLLQLPHFDAALIKHTKVGKHAVTNVLEFIRADVRKGMKGLTAQQAVDVDAVCRHLPDLTIGTSIFVEDEEQLVEGDIVTLAVTLTRANLHEQEEIGVVHAPLFPHLKREVWYLILAEPKSGKIIAMSKVKKAARVVEEKLMFQAPPAGKYEFELHVKCDSYLGVDQKLPVRLDVLSTSEVKREVFVHPEDLALDDEPSMFEQLMGAGGRDDDSDEELEEEEAQDGSPARQKEDGTPADAGQGTGLSDAGQGEESESDSDA